MGGINSVACVVQAMRFLLASSVQTVLLTSLPFGTFVVIAHVQTSTLAALIGQQ